MLSEAELGAAVIYAEPSEPQFSYVADSEGPPQRRLRIWSSPPGWQFAFDEIAPDGSARPGRDTWEETWERILLYPEMYAPKDILWRDERSGEVVDVYSLNPPQCT